MVDQRGMPDQLPRSPGRIFLLQFEVVLLLYLHGSDLRLLRTRRVHRLLPHRPDGHLHLLLRGDLQLNNDRPDFFEFFCYLVTAVVLIVAIICS